MLDMLRMRAALTRNQLQFLLARKLPGALGLPRFDCPVCGERRPFSDFGHPIRKRIRCTGCGSLERHRGFWLYLQTTRIFDDKLSVLHFAPEQFAERLQKLPNLDYLTADLNPTKAMVVVDIAAMAFEDARFDIIICHHVLEHVPDDRKAMRELLRVLRPGGFAVVMVPLQREPTFEDPSIQTPAGRLRAFGQDDHVRVYGPDIEQRLAEAGFAVERLPFWERFGAEACARHRLDEGPDAPGARVLFVCRRPG